MNNPTKHTTMLYVTVENTPAFYFTQMFDECTKYDCIEMSMLLAKKEKDA